MRYVVLTDDPERLRRLHGSPSDWRQMAFPNAAEALAWRRAMRERGAEVIDGQGWAYGCTFSEAHRCGHTWFGGSRVA